MAITREVITISMPREDVRRLNKIAKQVGKSRSHFVRDAINKTAILEEFDRLTRIGEKIAQKMDIETYEDVERIFGRHS